MVHELVKLAPTWPLVPESGGFLFEYLEVGLWKFGLAPLSGGPPRFAWAFLVRVVGIGFEVLTRFQEALS